MEEIFSWDMDARPFDPVDELVQRWGDVVVPIFVNDARSDQVADGIGSGFLTIQGSRLFLVTAAHVIAAVQKARVAVANIQGKAVFLNGMKFSFISDYDIAAVELTEPWMLRHGCERLKAIPAPGSEQSWRRTGAFVLAGYPASKNRLDLRYGKTNRSMRAITVEAAANVASTKIADGRAYVYDHENVIDSELRALGPQAGLHGMSGGPCMELIATSTEDARYRFGFACTGVLCEWHKDRRLVVTTPPEAIVAVCLFASGEAAH
jgi:hypothetical protein